MARQALAQYDADPARMLAATEALLEQFPDDVNLRLAQFAYLRVLGRREERLACYRELCSRPTADPILFRQYARELLADARELPTVVRLIERALRARPTDAISMSVLAEARWNERCLSESLELYRFATCLDDKDEVAGPQLLDGGAALAPRRGDAAIPAGTFPPPRLPVAPARAHSVLGTFPARAHAGSFRGTRRSRSAPARRWRPAACSLPSRMPLTASSSGPHSD